MQVIVLSVANRAAIGSLRGSGSRIDELAVLTRWRRVGNLLAGLIFPYPQVPSRQCGGRRQDQPLRAHFYRRREIWAVHVCAGFLFYRGGRENLYGDLEGHDLFAKFWDWGTSQCALRPG